MQGDPEIIEALNEILTAELTAINQYFIHAKMRENWGFKRLADDGPRRVHRGDGGRRQDHRAHPLPRRRAQPAALQPRHRGRDRARAAGAGARDREVAAIERYNRHIALAVAKGDNGTRELLEHRLVDEESHADWLEAQLQLIDTRSASRTTSPSSCTTDPPVPRSPLDRRPIGPPRRRLRRRFERLAAQRRRRPRRGRPRASTIAPGARVLDAGCGTGRVGIELARRGFEVTGTDIDPAMLAAARRRRRRSCPGSKPISPALEPRRPLTPWCSPATSDLRGRGHRGDGRRPLRRAPRPRRRADRRLPGPAATGSAPRRSTLDAARSGLELVDRWSTWDRQPWSARSATTRSRCTAPDA